MKPVVSAFNAWSWFVALFFYSFTICCLEMLLSALGCLPEPLKQANLRPFQVPLPPTLENPSLTSPPSIVISIFAIVILGVLSLLFSSSHHSVMDSTEDPADGSVVAKTALGAIGVYGVRFLFVIAIHQLFFKRILKGRGKDVAKGYGEYNGERGIALGGGEVREG